MRPTTILIALLAALAGSAAPLAGAGAKEFRSSDVHPLDYPTVQAVMYMGKLIGERTGGKNSVKVFGQSTLGSEKDTIEQTKIGALDMVRVNVAPFNNIVPATIVPSLPFLFKSTAHMRRVLDGPIGDEILAAMESQGFIGLCFYDSGSRSFYSGKKAIKNVADAKGMKIRVQQSDMWVAMMQAIGANATPMPYAEVYTALKTGVVDAAENNWPSYESSRHYEAAKYLQPDRAFDGAGNPGLLQEDLGRAVEGGPGRSSAPPPRNRCPTCASCGTSARLRRARRSRPRAARSSPTSTRSRSPTPWRRSTPSSRPTPSCRIW